jgi:hypothetical protein
MMMISSILNLVHLDTAVDPRGLLYTYTAVPVVSAFLFVEFGLAYKLKQMIQCTKFSTGQNIIYRSKFSAYIYFVLN